MWKHIHKKSNRQSRSVITELCRGLAADRSSGSHSILLSFNPCILAKCHLKQQSPGQIETALTKLMLQWAASSPTQVY